MNEHQWEDCGVIGSDTNPIYKQSQLINQFGKVDNENYRTWTGCDMCMFRLLDDDGPGGGDELMSSKTGLSMEYVIADVLLDGDFERFMFVIRFIRLTAVDDVVDSFLSLLLFDDCEDPVEEHENDIYSCVCFAGSVFVYLPPVTTVSLFLKNVSTLPNGLDHTDP